MPEPLQLQWQEVAPGLWWAEHPLGSYYVDLWGWRPSHESWTACQPVELSHAAAQADFERRLRACYQPETTTAEKE